MRDLSTEHMYGTRFGVVAGVPSRFVAFKRRVDFSGYKRGVGRDSLQARIPRSRGGAQIDIVYAIETVLGRHGPVTRLGRWIFTKDRAVGSECPTTVLAIYVGQNHTDNGRTRLGMGPRRIRWNDNDGVDAKRRVQRVETGEG